MLASSRCSRNICWVDRFVVGPVSIPRHLWKSPLSSVRVGLFHSCVMTEGGGSQVRPAGLGQPSCLALPPRLSTALVGRLWVRACCGKNCLQPFSVFFFNVKSYSWDYVFSFSLKYTWNTRGIQKAWLEDRGELLKLGGGRGYWWGALSRKPPCLPRLGWARDALSWTASQREPRTRTVHQSGCMRRQGMGLGLSERAYVLHSGPWHPGGGLVPTPRFASSGLGLRAPAVQLQSGCGSQGSLGRARGWEQPLCLSGACFLSGCRLDGSGLPR